MELLHHTIEHTLPMIPILFITYLVMELIEQKHWNPELLTNSRFSPVIASLAGLVPQCGLPGLYANLYAARLITTGTLIASFISCSDEMLPLLISAQVPTKEILGILIVKFLTGSIFGMILHLNSKRLKTDIETLCHNENCGCEENIFKSALIHTLKITWTLLLVTFILELVMHEAVHLIETLMNTHIFIQLILSILVGLIPNCASSILLTQLYLSNVLPFSVLMAGLCANAGTGLIVLARVNPDKKDTLRILILLAVCSFITGILLSFI